jgi:uncharacterized protein (DUF302 family)
MSTERLITVESSFPHEERVQRLEAAVSEGGMTPFAHIDHAAGAAGVGLVLRPTQVLIFGNPRAGVLLMQITKRLGLICRCELSSGRTTMIVYGCRTSSRLRSRNNMALQIAKTCSQKWASQSGSRSKGPLRLNEESH